MDAVAAILGPKPAPVVETPVKEVKAAGSPLKHAGRDDPGIASIQGSLLVQVRDFRGFDSRFEKGPVWCGVEFDGKVDASAARRVANDDGTVVVNEDFLFTLTGAAKIFVRLYRDAACTVPAAAAAVKLQRLKSNEPLTELFKLESPNDRAKVRLTLALLDSKPDWRGKLELSVLRGEMLREGVEDCYVELKFKGMTGTTQRRDSRHRNPQWNEHFLLDIHDATKQKAPQVTVYDFLKKTSQREESVVELGKGTIDITSLTKEHPTIIRLPMNGNPKTPGGEVVLEALALEMGLTPEVLPDASGKLRVRVVEAAGMMPKDCEGEPSLSLALKVGVSTYETRVVRDTGNPRFDEEFTMAVRDTKTEEPHVELWDTDEYGKVVMGRASLRLDLLVKGEEVDQWVNLDCGKLHVQLCADFGVPQEGERAPETCMLVHVARGVKPNPADLANLSTWDIPDPFVRIILGEHILNTSTKFDTFNPVWNETLILYVPQDDPTLQVEYWDADVLGDPVGLGFVQLDMLNPNLVNDVPVQMMVLDPTTRKWVPAPDKEHTPVIQLYITPLVPGQGDVAAAERMAQEWVAKHRQAAGGPEFRKQEVEHMERTIEKRKVSDRKKQAELENDRFLAQQEIPAYFQDMGYSAYDLSEDGIRNLFDLYDTEGNGRISKEEFKAFYKGFKTYGMREQFEAKVDAIVREHKLLGDDYLSFEEFSLLILQLAKQ
eukprot:TRINITY_DN7967_c0_g1_i1.p1 TRINITY_DN7967_c0_g1~~TRINITY_DN7967_c0_g1_i1.p1  ORF type:complete len:717 (+),score=335.94 TRINITY_DN7967_c0_g1_i1:45-2195(+)